MLIMKITSGRIFLKRFLYNVGSMGYVIHENIFWRICKKEKMFIAFWGKFLIKTSYIKMYVKL